MDTLSLAVLGLAAASLGLGGLALHRDTPLDWRFAPPDPVPTAGPGRFVTVLSHAAPVGQAHAPAIVECEGGFMITWFQGPAEAQPDVGIHAVTVTRQDGGWHVSPPHMVLTPPALAGVMDPAQRVVTLGNTIPNEGRPGHLFTTVVSVGGWAMAAIADVRMGPAGPERARKLNLSPILNRSFLAKSPMLAHADGSHALPAYFEMGRAFGALVRFGPDGRVRDRRWMRARGGRVIQPMIVALDAQRALAFLRDLDRGGVLWLSRSTDGGRTWSPATRTDRPNPGAPVAALGLGQGRILMAANDDAAHPDALILSLSEDEGATWRNLHRIDGPGMLRYPMLRRVGADIVLTCSTGGKRGIAAHVFDAAWVWTR